MRILDSVLQALAAKLGRYVQGRDEGQSYRDADRKGSGYSVECEVAESLADLMLLLFQMPVEGESERARWLDGVSDEFKLTKLKRAVCSGFVWGDCVVVPSWNGETIDNVIVDASDFAIFSAVGDRITSMAYVVDEKKLRGGSTYTLLQLIELVPYAAQDGTEAKACRYRLFMAKNGALTDEPIETFPDWAEYEADWAVPNVERLLVGRYKSFAYNPQDPNSTKGVPICFGAGAHIREIHYLLDQMHTEFGMSEKAIMADKRMFRTVTPKGRDGKPMKGADGSPLERLCLPKGRERLFVGLANRAALDGSPLIHDWSPEIRYQAYLDAIDKQEKLVEKAVGVNGGVISDSNDLNYQNVDNVRKSSLKTQSFINTARGVCEAMLGDLLYAWDAIANHYGVTPVGEWEASYDWSDEYITTFADKQQAILAGESVGATDALDYRLFVMGEPPEVAKQRVEEIAAAKRAAAPAFAPAEPEPSTFGEEE